jgi:hypothetical protein
MKKHLFFALFAFAALAFSACNKNKPDPVYVDLGLPSGTLWKSENESTQVGRDKGIYTFDEAVETFGDQLPTIAQWRELVSECEWKHEIGYTVVGPNGNSITLTTYPATRYCNGNIDNGSSHRARYWSSTEAQRYSEEEERKALYLYVDWDSNQDKIILMTDPGEVCGAILVRLVK